MYKIKELVIKDARKIEAVDITPKDDINVLEGKNENGKSTVLDSIESLFTTNVGVDDNIVKNGKDRSEFSANIGPYVIRRVVKKGKPDSISIKKTIDGKKADVTSTEFLNDITGKVDKDSVIALDISKIINMDSKKRTATIMKISGIDEDEVAKIRKNIADLKDDRKIVNKELKKLQAEVEGFGVLQEVKNPGSVADLIAEQTANAEKLKGLNSEKESYSKLHDTVSETEKRIAELQLILKRDKERLALMDIDAVNDRIAELETKSEELTRKIQDISDLTTQYNKYVEYESKVTVRDEKAKESEEIKKKIEAEVEKGSSLMENANYPIKGMTIKRNEIFFNGIHFDQLSSSRKMKVALSIAANLNPKLRVLIIRNGNEFDKESMNMVAKWAKKNDFQIWIERVADLPDMDDTHLYIEEGKILTQEEKKDKLRKILEG